MKVLFVTGGGIGDLLMTTPMYRALKNERPNVHVTVLIVQSVNRHLLHGNPFVDDVIDWNDFTGSVFKLSAELRGRGFTHAVHNHSCPRWRFYTVPLLAGIPNRFGFDRRSTGKGMKTLIQKWLLTGHVPYRAKEELRTRMNLHLMRHIGIRDDDISYGLHLETSAKADPERVGMHPGSDGRGAIKRWPAEHFMELAGRLVREHAKSVVFYIGPAEKELKHVIRPENGIEVKECPSISALVKDMSACGSFISNDSGISHIAAALKIPTVVLFGPTKPDEYVLPTKNTDLCTTGFDCHECFRTKKCQHCAPTCLTTLTVDEVLSGYTELMETGR